jgi:mycothiol synthase
MLNLANAQIEQVQLPSGSYTFRRQDLATDIPRSVQLINEIEAVDQIGWGTTEEELRADLTSPNYDVNQDGWIVEEPGRPDRLIAEGWSVRIVNTERAWIGARVHPAWRRRGLGSELLRRALARAAEQGARYVDGDATGADTPAHAFLREHGFAPTKTWVEMRCPADRALDAPVWPAGYQVRPYSEVQDAAMLTDALNRGFIGHWENRERTVDEITHRLEGPSARPEGIFLAFGPAGDVAGVCWADISEARNTREGAPVGYINSLGVVPEHRRLGLGRALLLAGMGWLRANGQGAVDLDAMGDNEQALPLYYSVGFAVKRQGTEYRRDL